MKKKMPLMLAVILILQIMLPMLTVIWENALTLKSVSYDGTEYYIDSAQDMWDFAEKVNNGDTFEGITVYLTSDINLNCNKNSQWIPIGDCNEDAGNKAESTLDKNAFAGVFNGNNHVISGIYIDTTENYIGLFGYNEGTIENIIIKESFIKSTNGYIGGITAYNKRNNKKLSQLCKHYK